MSQIPRSKNIGSKSVFDRRESNVQSYARAFPATFDKALGVDIFDTNGKRYIDFLAGAGSLNYGHNNPLFKDALISYISDDGITHGLDMHTVAKERFLTTFEEVILEPRNLDYVVQFTGPTGTNAVEAALKIARKATGRSNVISFTNGFHGVSLGSLSLTGNKFLRQAAGVEMPGTTQMPFDGYYGDDVDTISMIDKVLVDPSSGVDAPAAIVVETVQGEGGLNAASASWMRQLRQLCTAHDIVMIVDDIQAGCGRTGTFFSFEESGIEPDIVTMSKSLSGYGLPFSIVLMIPSLDVWKPGEHNGTFRGNNHAFVTATAALQHYWADEAFERAIKQKAAMLEDRLQSFVDQYPEHFVRVKGRGMMRGIECKDPDGAGAITAQAFRYGLIIERAGPSDEVVKCLMALTITKEELQEGLDLLEAAIADVFRTSAIAA